MNHDQNFKNLILDYPRQALEFFAAAEAGPLEWETARITPVRQEQLQERLGERFRELDTPLLVEWPDGRRCCSWWKRKPSRGDFPFIGWRMIVWTMGSTSGAVGALCLVAKDLEAFGIYAGSPLKRVKARSQRLLELEKPYLASSG